MGVCHRGFGAGPPESLWITIYLDDDEAFDIWHDVVGVPADRILRKDKKDNFWEIGGSGPVAHVLKYTLTVEPMWDAGPRVQP